MVNWRRLEDGGGGLLLFVMIIVYVIVMTVPLFLYDVVVRPIIAYVHNRSTIVARQENNMRKSHRPRLLTRVAVYIISIALGGMAVVLALMAADDQPIISLVMAGVIDVLALGMIVFLRRKIENNQSNFDDSSTIEHPDAIP